MKFIEIRNPFLDLDHTWHDSAWSQEETFLSSRSAKKLRPFDDATKPFFGKKSQKFIVRPILRVMSYVAAGQLDNQEIWY